jgi:hypothetical protein
LMKADDATADTGPEEPDPSDEDRIPQISVEQNVDSNDGVVVGVLAQTVQRIVGSIQLRPDHIDECVRAFASSPTLEEARSTLRNERVVVLTGEFGVGRHTTAVKLLNEVDNLKLHRVRRESDEEFVIDQLVPRQNRGWLLDLRSEDAHVDWTFGRDLADSASLLRDSNSFLAVAIRPDLWEQVGSGAHHLAVRLQPPAPEEVIRLRLSRFDPKLPPQAIEAWLNQPEIIDRIKGASTHVAVSWAEDIRKEYLRARELGNIGTDKENVKNVIAAREDWHTSLSNWHRNKDSRQRNYLLAAAVLEGAPADTIYGAAERLCELFEEPDAKKPGQTGPGIIHLTEDAEAIITEAETVRFRRVGFADAVLEYFWVDRMNLRDTFVSWMSMLPLEHKGALHQAVIDRIGEYVLRWSIKRRRLKLLEDVVRKWASSRELAAEAEALITVASLHPTLGKITRDRILELARSDPETDGELKRVLARACGGELGRIYPKMMLLRLGYLARTADAGVAEAVKNAMGTLWNVPEIRSRIRTEIKDWCTGRDVARREAGRRSFLALARLSNGEDGSPVLLKMDGSDFISISDDEKSFLVDGWRAVLDAQEKFRDAIETFNAWMDFALHYFAAKEHVVDIFCLAVHRPYEEYYSGRRHVTLTKLLFSWQPNDTAASEKTELRDQILARSIASDPWQTGSRESV